MSDPNQSFDNNSSRTDSMLTRLRQRRPWHFRRDGEETRGRDAVGRVFRSPAGPISWRRNLYAIWLAQLLVIMGFNMRTPFLPMFLQDLGLSTAERQAFWTGLMLSLGAGMMAITSPIWGAVADSRGRKPMLVRAQLAAFVFIGLCAFAQTPMQLTILRVFEGGMTGTVAAATALVAVSMPQQRMGFGLGMVQTAVFSGAALGPLIGGVVADTFGFHASFYIASGMALAAAVVTFFFVEERFERPADLPASEKPRESMWHLLIGPALLTLTLTMVVVRFASSAVQPITPIFVAHLSPNATNVNTLAGITLGILGVTSAISSVFLGRMGDKRGHYSILVLCTLGSGLIYLPMAAAQSTWQLIGLQAIFGVFAGGMIPAANALVARVTEPSRRGVIFGLMNTAGSLGGFIGPLTGAAVAAAFGIRFTFLMTGVLLLILMSSLVWANARRPMEPGSAQSST